jgi:hypothetical protein
MTVERYRPVARSVEQLVNDYLSEEPTFLFSGLEANIGIAISAIQAVEIAEGEEDHRWRGDFMRTVIRKVAKGETRFQFAENPKYRNTLNSVFETYPLARVKANESLIIRAGSAAQIPFDNVQAILDLVAEPSIWNSLVLSQQHLEQTQATRLREQMISEMTQSGTKPFSLRTGNLNSETYDTQGRKVQFSGSGGRRFVASDQGFSSMTDEQIKAMHDQWSTQQQYNRMSTEDLRKTVRQQGKEHLEQKFRGNPITGQSSTPTTAASILIDPRSGRPITRRIDLINYINSSDGALAQLVKPKGHTIRERALEVDRLLGAKD